MAQTLHKIGRLNYDFEALFGGGGAGPWTELLLREPPSVEGIMATYIEEESMKPGLYKDSGTIGQQSDSTISLRIDVHGLLGTIPLVPPLVDFPQSDFCGLAMGNVHYMGAAFGATVAGISTSIIDLALGEAANYVSGQPVCIETTEGYEPGVIKEIAVDDVTLRSDLLAAPGAAKTLYSGMTCFPANAWQMESMAFELLGQSAADKWLLNGCRPTSLKFIGTPKEFVVMEMDFSINNFSRPGSGGAPAYAVYDFPPREHLVGGILRIENGASITQLDFTSFEFDFGLATTQPTDGTNDQGAGDLLMTDFAARLTVDPSYLNEDMISAFTAQTKYDLILKYGHQPGRIFLLTLAQAELVQFPSLHNGEEVKRQKLIFEAKVYVGDVGAVSDNVPTSKDCAACWL